MRSELKREIYRAGYTVEGFAKKTGLSVLGLYQIYKGKYKKCQGHTINAIAKGLGKSYEEMKEFLDE